MFDDYSSVLLVGTLNSFAEETARGIIDFETYVTDTVPSGEIVVEDGRWYVSGYR